MVTAVTPEIAIRSRSAAARGRYIELTERVVHHPQTSENELVMLKKSVAWLELFHISALTWEYIHQHDIHSLEQLEEHASEIVRRILLAIPDVEAHQETRDILGELPIPAEIVSGWPADDWPQLIRSFDAIVAECPIERLEAIGRSLDEPRLAYRARCAYDALQAFVRRHDPRRAEVMRIVGEQYRRGNLRVHDAARLLGMSSSDATFELEQDGFSRAPEQITLTEAEREAAYLRLRQRRLQHVTPAADPDLVKRDVIASERIEGVDARAWIRGR
jgi:hypothetical protein